MRLDLITLFPEACQGYLDASIVGRARRRGLIDVTCIDPRAWADGRHKTVDDRPFGGGPGMVLAAPPIAECLDWVQTRSRKPRLLMTSPQGRAFDQAFAGELAGEAHVVVLCGHYEGIDERIVQIYKPELFSVGNYVLSGGELAALVLVDAVTRLIPGALGNLQSAVEESFQGDGFDHPCFTRPREFRGREVPAALTSGDHAKITEWRAAQRAKQTRS